MNNIVLENDLIKAVFDAENGALLEVKSKATEWNIQNRSILGLSFYMLVPMNDRRNNPVLGSKQKLKKYEVSPAGDTVTFIWDNLESEHGGTLDIEFKGVVKLNTTDLTFDGEVNNNSPYVIETISYPCIGDMPKPQGNENLNVMLNSYDGLRSSSLLPIFSNGVGYWGSNYPGYGIHTPEAQYVLICNDKQGLYVGCHDTSAMGLVRFNFELKPGYTNSLTKLAPSENEISGNLSRIEFTTIHFPFINPKESANLSTIVLKPYEGNFWSGIDIYKEWRKTWFTPTYTVDWAKDVHSWYQIHINSPEDDLFYRYTDLVKLGEDCARHGIKAIQLVGWNKGGQDRGNPFHDIDPRLGTWQELHDAIEKVQEMGVKIILFTKFTWIDMSLDWYKSEGIKYAAKDPYGDVYHYNGYSYQTTTQLANINTRRLTPTCMMSTEWRKFAAVEFKKVS